MVCLAFFGSRVHERWRRWLDGYGFRGVRKS